MGQAHVLCGLGAGLARVWAGLGGSGASTEPVSCETGASFVRVGCFWLCMGCAGLDGFDWFAQEIDMRFAWPKRRFGAGLARLGAVLVCYSASMEPVSCGQGASLVRVGCFWLCMGCAGLGGLRLTS